MPSSDEHRPATEVGDQVQRRDGRPVAVPDGVERAGLRQVVDVVARRHRQRTVLTPAGDAGEDQPRVDRRALVGPDAEPFAGAGPEAVEQHVGLRGEVEQLLRFVLDVKVDDALAAVQQVDVLGGHLQTAGPAHPHHVGAEVGEHHRGVRAGPDAAEFDDLHPGEGSRVGHAGDVLSGSTAQRLMLTTLSSWRRQYAPYALAYQAVEAADRRWIRRRRL